jgi:hypothetical protein
MSNNDHLTGAAAIANYIGRSTRATYHLLEQESRLFSWVAFLATGVIGHGCHKNATS